MNIALSVLEPAPPSGGAGAAQAVHDIIDLARVADRAGYLRFWVAPRHPARGGSPTPALVSLIAAATGAIRVGSGWAGPETTAPHLVAQRFCTVEGLHPGRIDLGLGRLDRPLVRSPRVARPVPPLRVAAGPWAAGRSVEPSLSGSLAALLGRLADADAATTTAPAPDDAHRVADVLSHLDARLRRPGGPRARPPAAGPDVWVLGSGARAAAMFGLPFAVDHHADPDVVLDAVAAYRAAFQPSRRLDRPRVAVSAQVLVASDDASARRLAGAGCRRRLVEVRAGRGPGPRRAPEPARTRRRTGAGRAPMQFVGSPATVAEQLAVLARATGADELLVTTVAAAHADRVRSHELLAAAWAAR